MLYCRHPAQAGVVVSLWRSHDGMIVCDDHVSLVTDVHHAAIELTDNDIAQIYGVYIGTPAFEEKKSCDICKTPPSEGRHCHYLECGKLLHPQWPAVYCSNRCAWRDAY